MIATVESLAREFHCRLCRRPLSASAAIPIGPFPQAAQYYPEPAEFATERGVLLNIVECPGCRLTQLLNEPVDYYRQVITAASLSPSMQRPRLALFRELRASLPIERPLQALEIGCASGENLPLLREAGFVATGIEFAPPEFPAPDESRGIFNRHLLDLGKEHVGHYDLLVAFNYLEHQPDARSFLEKCHVLLTDAGKLLLTVPNLDYLLSSRSGHEFVTDHLVYFTSETLETALRLTGFVLEDLRIINNQYDIQIIASKRKTGTVSACKAALDELIAQLNKKLRGLAAEGKTVAVWGAGHRTLALLSLCEHHLIACIIDSAKFKHHKFAPLSHLQILPPETLLDPECGIDVILIMVPGIYPAEVIRQIQALPIRYHAEQFPPEG